MLLLGIFAGAFGVVLVIALAFAAIEHNLKRD